MLIVFKMDVINKGHPTVHVGEKNLKSDIFGERKRWILFDIFGEERRNEEFKSEDIFNGQGLDAAK
jgi:hypothetical protein